MVVVFSLRLGGCCGWGAARRFGERLPSLAPAALSRAMLPAILRWLPPARPPGMGAEAGRPRVQAVVAAAIIGGLVALITLGPVIALAAATLAAVGAAAVALLAWRQIGGHTGDVCGAAQQTAEVAALLAVVAWR